MKIASRLTKLSPSLTLALSAKAKAMKGVLTFGVGEPDFDTPDFIKQVAIEDLTKGKTKYTASKGTPEVLKAVVDYLAKRYKLEYNAKNILISAGGKHSLYNIFMAIVDREDEVIIPSPYWLSYPEQVIAAEGKPVILQCGPEAGFKVTPAQLEAAITPKTVAFVFNSPSNPTGAVYSRQEIAALAEVLKKHPHVTIISDDLYEHLVYAPAEFVSILTLAPELKERTIIVNGWSKAYAMTGWRLGWLAGPAAVVEAMDNLQSHSTSNVTSFIQRAGAVALESDHAFLKDWIAEFDARRKLLVSGLNALPGVRCTPEPMGAFYAFPDVSAWYGKELGGRVIKGSLDFSDVVLEKALVALVPGIAFGEDRCVRLSYATSREIIAEGLERLGKLLA
jgi:aspartate aminotransferase